MNHRTAFILHLMRSGAASSARGVPVQLATAGLLLNNVKIPRDSCGQPLNAKGKLVFIVAFVGGDFWSTVVSEWSILCRKRVLCPV